MGIGDLGTNVKIAPDSYYDLRKNNRQIIIFFRSTFQNAQMRLNLAYLAWVKSDSESVRYLF